MRYHRVPDLCSPAEMSCRRHTLDGSIPRSAQVVGLQFDRREAGGARRKVRDATVTCRSIGKCDDAARVKVPVRRHELPADGKLGPYFLPVDGGDDDAEIP